MHRYASTTPAGSVDSDSELGFLVEMHGKLWYKTYDDIVKRLKLTSTELYLPQSKKDDPNNWKLVMIGSCNGLVCFCLPHCGVPDCAYSFYDYFYICNPITGEHIDLPRLLISREGVELLYKYCLVSGFGYLPSTKQYKMLRIVNANRPSLDPKVQVYTLGEGNEWRDATDLEFLRFMEFHNEKGILANGELHWLALGANGREVVAFNLEKEEFHLVPSPPCVWDRDYHSLCVLGGCLCLVHRVRDKYDSPKVELWLLKKKTCSASSYCVKQVTYSWHCEHQFNEDGSKIGEWWTVNRGPTVPDVKEAEDQGWSWSVDFTIPTDEEIIPLALTNKSEVLLLQSGCVFCYDPTTATLTKVAEDQGLTTFHVTPHINSFVSLESLEEEQAV